MILAIDPGTEQSAWVLMQGKLIVGSGIEDNAALVSRIRRSMRWASSTSAAARVCHEKCSHVTLIIEKVESYGMPVGADVFETVYWTGRMAEAAQPWVANRIPRKDVKIALCGSMKAKDANIRQALIDRYGGSKKKAVGIKAKPGPLYGVKSHIWSALAVAVTWQIQQEENGVG